MFRLYRADSLVRMRVNYFTSHGGRTWRIPAQVIIICACVVFARMWYRCLNCLTYVIQLCVLFHWHMWMPMCLYDMWFPCVCLTYVNACMFVWHMWFPCLYCLSDMWLPYLCCLTNSCAIVFTHDHHFFYWSQFMTNNRHTQLFTVVTIEITVHAKIKSQWKLSVRVGVEPTTSWTDATDVGKTNAIYQLGWRGPLVGTLNMNRRPCLINCVIDWACARAENDVRCAKYKIMHTCTLSKQMQSHYLPRCITATIGWLCLLGVVVFYKRVSCGNGINLTLCWTLLMQVTITLPVFSGAKIVICSWNTAAHVASC